MSESRYFILSLVIIIAQMVLANFLNLSVFITLSFLPAIILLAPQSIRGIPLMLLAFAFGLFFNFFADGMLGLASVSLVPVALLRRKILSFAFRIDSLSGNDRITLQRQGYGKFLLALMIGNLVYFIFLVPIEAAGTREPAFMLIKILLSTLTSGAASLLVAHILDLHE